MNVGAWTALNQEGVRGPSARRRAISSTTSDAIVHINIMMLNPKRLNNNAEVATVTEANAFTRSTLVVYTLIQGELVK